MNAFLCSSWTHWCAGIPEFFPIFHLNMHKLGGYVPHKVEFEYVISMLKHENQPCTDSTKLVLTKILHKFR